MHRPRGTQLPQLCAGGIGPIASRFRATVGGYQKNGIIIPIGACLRRSSSSATASTDDTQAFHQTDSSPHPPTYTVPLGNMSRNPMDEYAARMRSMVRHTRGAFSGGGPPPGTPLALAGIALVGGAVILFQNSLFNVDGGHRAIKYKRISGVGKEIYSEGPSRSAARLALSTS